MNDPADAERILQLVFMVHRDAGCIMAKEMSDKGSVHRDMACVLFTGVKDKCCIYRVAGNMFCSQRYRVLCSQRCEGELGSQRCMVCNLFTEM